MANTPSIIAINANTPTIANADGIANKAFFPVLLIIIREIDSDINNIDNDADISNTESTFSIDNKNIIPARIATTPTIAKIGAIDF